MVLDPYDFHRWGKWGVLPGTDNTPSTMKPTTELGRLPYPVHSNGRATTLKVVDSGISYPVPDFFKFRQECPISMVSVENVEVVPGTVALKFVIVFLHIMCNYINSS